MKYPKIQTLWQRDKDRNFVIMEGCYTKLEFEVIQVWEVTEKVDGTNIRVICNKDTIVVKGKTDKAQRIEPLYTIVENIFTRELIDSAFDWDKAECVVLYGEGYGSKIQKGGKYREDQSFVLFDILIDNIWLEGEQVTEFAIKLGIDRVPVLGNFITKDIIEYVNGFMDSRIAIEDNVPSEGVVCRSVPLMLDRFGNRIMWKLKAKDYEQLRRLAEE